MMRFPSTIRSRAASVAIVVAILSTACGGSDDSVLAAGDDFKGWTDTPTTTVAEPADGGAETTATPVRTDETTTTAKEVVDPVDALVFASDPGDPVVNAQVLAYAIEASEALNYGFTQGFAMDMAFGGFEMGIAPEGPMVRGTVDGDRSHLVTDLGVVFAETFATFGIDPAEVPELAALTENATFEAWVDGTVMTIDMSDFLSAIEVSEPGVSDELGALADGPVRVDLAALDGVDPATITQQLGQGSQAVDPAALLAALRDVDSVAVVGTGTAAGRSVTIYSGSLGMDEYLAAMGQDLESQMGMFEGMGVPTDDAMVDSVVSSISAIDVDVTILVDDDGLIRRIEHDMDMAPMLEGLFDDPALGGDTSLFGEVTVTMSVWQEFDGYGEQPPIEVPEAVDVTADFETMLGELATV